MNKRNISQHEGQPAEPVRASGPSATVNPSYQRAKPFIITDDVRRAIKGAVAEIDMKQVRLMRSKTPAEKFQMAFSMINAAERAGTYRLRQREPELSREEALRIIRGGLMNYLRRRAKS